jgi:uncharacterized membrane protein
VPHAICSYGVPREALERTARRRVQTGCWRRQPDSGDDRRTKEHATMARTGGNRPAIVGAFATRPRLVCSVLAGVVVGGGLAFIPGISPGTAVAAGWDVLCLAFIGLMTLYMRDRNPEAMRNHAAEADEGRFVVLALILAGSVASFGAIAMELTAAKDAEGLAQAGYIALAFFTMAMSWYFVQLNFALHYAHAYYTHAEGKRTDAGGLAFPGTKTPDYWDFLHFSIVIGVASQTADIAFTDKALRRLGTSQSLFAFVFNTVVVALTINLFAGLF